MLKYELENKERYSQEEDFLYSFWALNVDNRARRNRHG